MIRLHNRSIGVYFFAPDAGTASGGSSAGTATNGAGGKDGGVELLDPKLFDQLPWNELDDETRTTLTKIKDASVATLQRATHLDKEYKRVDAAARAAGAKATIHETRLTRRFEDQQLPLTEPHVDFGLVSRRREPWPLRPCARGRSRVRS